MAKKETIMGAIGKWNNYEEWWLKNEITSQLKNETRLIRKKEDRDGTW